MLPFDNLSGQPEETYFSDGITEDIITGLARFRSLFVIARNSSFAFRGKSIDLAEIGRRLGVSYLLEGSVRRAGDRVRITAQLIEAANGAHLWAERYDRSLDDIFAVQDEVAQHIVSTLVGRIEDARLQQSLRKPTVSLAAYDCVSARPWPTSEAMQPTTTGRPMRCLSGRSRSTRGTLWRMSYLASWGWRMHGHAAAPTEVLDAAFATAAHALELDPQESRCHAGAGAHLALSPRIRHGRAAFTPGPRSQPERCRQQYGRWVASWPCGAGRRRRSSGWRRPCASIRSTPPGITLQLGVALYSLRRYAEAAQAFKRVPDPGYWSRARLAACYAQLGTDREAEAQAAAVLQHAPRLFDRRVPSPRRPP